MPDNTIYVETEILLAMKKGDRDRAKTYLEIMRDEDLKAYSLACVSLCVLIKQVLKERGG